MPQIKLIIVDDHQLILDGIKDHIKNQDRYALKRIYTDGPAFCLQLPVLEYDVLLCDIAIPGQNGFILCEESKRAYPERKVVFFSGYKEPVIMEGVKNSKADGFISKNVGIEELFEAIDRVLVGERVIPTDLITDKPGIRVLGNGKELNSFETFGTKLSPQEKEVLILYAKGFKNKDISEQMGLSPHTVKTYRRRIFNKLDVHDMQELMRFCWECGLM